MSRFKNVYLFSCKYIVIADMLQMLSEITKKCLSEAEKRGLCSVTFPAIGTGNLGYPKDIVASLMLEQVIHFSSKKQLKHLKEVTFILHPSDQETIQVWKSRKIY